MPSVALESQTRAAICSHLQLHVNVCAVRLGAIVLAASWPSTHLPPPRRWRAAEPVRIEQAYAVLWASPAATCSAATLGVFSERGGEVVRGRLTVSELIRNLRCQKGIAKNVRDGEKGE